MKTTRYKNLMKHDYTTIFIIILNFFVRHVVVSFDEMKLRKGLVFDKESGHILGYSGTGDINEKFEAEVKERWIRKK
jgi:hypothetical protein